MNKFGLSHDYPLMKTLSLVKVELDESGEIAKFAYGIMTAESPDKEGEVANYESAKKNTQTWSDEFVKATSGSGQDLSLGNIRQQHGLALGGKATKIDFDDDSKVIKLGTVPVNDEVGRMLKQGFYTGYSIGGDYEWRRCKECALDIPKGNYCKTCRKNVLIEYSPLIAEVSYVDNPCHGEAHFELVKADGSKQLAKFAEQQRGASTMDPEATPQNGTGGNPVVQNINLTAESSATIADLVAKSVDKALRVAGVVKEAQTKRKGGKDLTSDCFAFVGDKSDPSTWKLPIKSPDGDASWEKAHIRNAISRFDQTQGIPADEKDKVWKKIVSAAKKHDIEVSDDVKKTLAAFDVVKAYIRDQFDGLCKSMIGDEAFDTLMKTDKLFKGMYDVAQMAGFLCDLAWIQNSAAWEAAYEGDDSQVPYELLDNLEALAETFLAMAEEEVGELTAAAAASGGRKVMKTLSAAELTKAVKPLSEHIKAAKATVSEHCDKLCKMHKAHEAAMHDHLDKMHKLMGAEEADKDEKSKSGENEPEPIDVTAEGTETIIKALESKGLIVMNQETLTKTIDSAIQALVKKASEEEGETEADDEEAEAEADDKKKKKSKKAAGVGSRADVPPMLSGSGGAVAVMPVIKVRDSGAASSQTPNAAAQAETPTVDTETVRKGLMGGDLASKLAMMKGVQSQSSVPSTLAGTKLGK